MPCPNCGRRIKYGIEDAGTEAFCPHCDTPVILETPADAPPPPPRPAGPSKAKLILIPAIAFVAVFGLIVTAAVLVKSGKKKKTEKAAQVEGDQAVEEEEARERPRKAKPKVKLLPGYKRPLKVETKKKLVFDNPTPRKPGDPTQLLGHKVIKAELGSMRYVVGLVTNHTAKTFFDVEIFFDLFDDKGKKIGEAKDYLGILAPHASWEFKATIFDRGAVSAKLRKIDKEAE